MLALRRVLRTLAFVKLKFLLVAVLPFVAFAEDPFVIRVVDGATGRGVPMVELSTVHGVTYITDNAGLVAFDELGLMDIPVFFKVTSHG